MKTTIPPNSWETLAAAYRLARPADPAASDEAAPFGFAPRLAALALAARRDERLGWWARWSMRAACTAGLAAAVVALLRDPAPLLSAPALEIPGFSSL